MSVKMECPNCNAITEARVTFTRDARQTICSICKKGFY